MKLNSTYISRINEEIKDTERKRKIQDQKKADTIEASQFDIMQNIENGMGAIVFSSTTTQLEEIEVRDEELKNHIIYLNNILERGEL